MLFNIKSLEFKETLDTAKCIANIESFLTTSELVVKHQLQLLITSKQLDQISRGLFLYNDLVDYEKVKGRHNTTVRNDSMTNRMTNIVTNLRNNTHSSMMNMSQSNCQVSSGFFQEDDIDVDANLSILAGREDKNIISEFSDLIDHATNMRVIYKSKIDGMSKHSLYREAQINSRLLGVKMTEYNTSVLDDPKSNILKPKDNPGYKSS